MKLIWSLAAAAAVVNAMEVSSSLPKLTSEAIQFKSVTGSSDFGTFHDWIEGTFPILVNSDIYEKTVINGSSLIYYYKKPCHSDHWLFYGHLDVVTVGNESDWTYGPFSGLIKDGFVHGRGAVDMKSHIVAFLYALNETSDKNRCWSVALGHDEEIDGWHGAYNIKKYLNERSILFDGMIDEGLPSLRNIVKLPHLRGKVLAMIGVAEKGKMNVRIKVKHGGGHSSLGSWTDNPVIVLSDLLNNIHKRNPFPVHWDALPTSDYLSSILGGIPKSMKLVSYLMTNVLVRIAPILRPLLSSTMTITGFSSGGTANNVVPMEASATLNIRIHPADSIESILSHITNACTDNGVSDVEIELLDRAVEASPISPYSPQYSLIEDAFKHVYQKDFNVMVLPALVIGGTDTKHLISLIKGNNAFRVTPFLFETPEDLSLYHGVNERISIENIARLYEFYNYLQ